MYSKRLKELREEPINFIRQKELAKLIGVHVSVYSKYENENQNEIIPLKHLNILCNNFNVSLDYIFNFTDIRNYPNSKKSINKSKFCQRLKELRKSQGLTQEKFSNVLKIQQSTISKYESGEREVSTQYLYAICKEFKISADYLLGKIDNI